MPSITPSSETKGSLAELKPPDLTWDEYLRLLLESVEPERFEGRLRERTTAFHRASIAAARRRVQAGRRPRALDQVREVVLAELPRLRSEFRVKALFVFGSVARGEERPDSDVDQLVEYEETPGLHELIGLKAFLEERLGRIVDLGTDLKPGIRDRAGREMGRLRHARTLLTEILTCGEQVETYTTDTSASDLADDPLPPVRSAVGRLLHDLR